MVPTRKPLADILAGKGLTDEIKQMFDTTAAADDFTPLPKGSYVCTAERGELTKSRSGTDGFQVEFRVVEGEFRNRRLWRTWYLTPDAMPFTKRDLLKLGIDTQAKLSRPLPAGRMVFKLTVAVRKDDDGTERNEVKKLDFLRVQEPEVDPFAPPPEGGVR
ncbi:MAG: DUF669 domain-containing protein [Gemmataceae bacterium]